MIENHSYTVAQDKANSQEAVKSWLGGEIAALYGFSNLTFPYGIYNSGMPRYDGSILNFSV